MGAVSGVTKVSEPKPDSKMRQKILNTAIRLFAQNGFRGTTTKEIALAAGVNEVTIFRHFATKQELYTAILDIKSNERVVKSWVEALRPFADRRDDQGLFLFVAREILGHYQRDPDFLCLRLHSSLEGHDLAKQYREQQVCPLFRFLRDYILTRQSEGVFRPFNPDITVMSFLGSVYNHAIARHFREVDFIKLSRDDIAQTFVDIFLGGVRVTGETKH
jgi:AcrR family transcriptional regulator